MTLEQIKGSLPDYAKDLRLNLDSVLSESGAPGLTAKQVAIIALTSAIASRYAPLTAAIVQHTAGTLSESEANGARTAAAIMAMNNIYYRFVHMMSERADANYKTMPAKLRMNVIGKPGVDKVDFELWSLAVSAVNGCGMCIESHEHHLRKAGFSAEQIQASIRIAAVVHAVAAVLDGEAAGNGLAAAA